MSTAGDKEQGDLRRAARGGLQRAAHRL